MLWNKQLSIESWSHAQRLICNCWGEISESPLCSFHFLRNAITDNQIIVGTEESACCLQETVLIMAVKEGGGWGMDQAGQKENREHWVVRGGEYMSKVTQVNWNMETFTSTKHTTTFVIYRYSSPSSFQLFENKKSRGISNNTALTDHVHIVTVFLFTELYIHTGAVCSIGVTLQRSKMHLWLLTWLLTMGGTSMCTQTRT